MQGIEFQIINDGEQASRSLNDLSQALGHLKSSVSGSTNTLGRVANSISQIKSALEKVNTGDFEGKMSGITRSLKSLKDTTDGLKISASIGNQIRAIGTALDGVKWTDGDKLEALANGLKPLGELGRSNLTSFISQLKKIPETVSALDEVDMDKFVRQISELATAIRPLADEANKIANGFSKLPSFVSQASASMENYSSIAKKSATRTSKWRTALSSVSGKIKDVTHKTDLLGRTLKTIGVAAIFRGVASVLSRAIKNASDYQETLAMFTVSMGEYAQQAYEYAKTVSEVMGIDLSTWMENQGVFNSIITGFGVAGDKAAVMSKNLTQLAYDLSSFYNTDITSAMQKVQSGISGELEPLNLAA